ncbi:MAG: hypothetical protein IIB57_15200 [Planctomycetes bacterium]|nr:hypothetical protein [Planctomycetota bacterium]
MTDHSDDPRENGSPQSPEDDSSMPVESGHTDSAPSAPQSEPSAPPMQPTDVVPGSVPTSWPTVLGILAIVFGGFGILGGVWGVVYPFVAGRLADMIPQMQAQLALQLEAWSGWSTVISIISFLAAGFLIFGGVSMVKRRRRATSILFIWSILKIVLIFAGVGVQLAVQSQVMDQVTAQLPTVPGGKAIMVGSVAVGLACGLIFQLAGPIFLLVWFRRGAIKEEVATWR